MIKFFSGMVVGVFVGALAIELIEKGSPELLDRVRQKARALGEKVRGSRVYVDNVLRRDNAPGAQYY